MTPNLGQGAGQAIEDAAALDHVLAESTSLEEALRAYEGRRVARANAITRHHDTSAVLLSGRIV